MQEEAGRDSVRVVPVGLNELHSQAKSTLAQVVIPDWS